MSEVLNHLCPLLVQVGAAPLARAIQDLFDPYLGRFPLAQAPYSSLAIQSCRALGGNPRSAKPASISWEILYLAAYLLDQITDKPEMEGKQGLIATLATACIPAARKLLSMQIEMEVETRQSLLADFDLAILRAITGQVEELEAKALPLEKCWEIARQKTGEIFALATRSGARIAGGMPYTLSLMSEFGMQLGLLVQIGDDINGLWTQKGGDSDLASSPWRLPVAYTMSVLSPPKQEWLSACLREVGHDPCAETEARQVIIESGALVYLAVEAERCRSRASQALMQAVPHPDNRQELLAILDQSVRWLLYET